MLQHPSRKDNERNLCQDLLTIENTDSDLKVLALHYGNELLNVCVRLSFQKLLQTRQTNRNNTKLSKTGFGYDFSIVRETHKLTRYHSKEFSYITFDYRTNPTSSSRYYSFTARNWSLVFDSEKLTFSISSKHRTAYKSPGSYSLPYSLKSL